MGLIYNTKQYFAHKDEGAQSDLNRKYESIEYHLICLGELRSPYLGSAPEHDINARWIFRGDPYRLFSVTEMGRIPQELCLMFDCYREEKRHDYGSVVFHPIEETAREFSALLSLITRRRVSLMSLKRREGYPVNEGLYAFSGYYRASELPVNRKVVYGLSPQGNSVAEHLKHYNPLREVSRGDFDRRLESPLHLESTTADAFLLGLRLYHAALEMMYQSTEVAYLLLVSAIESAASIEFKNEKKWYRFKRFITEYLPSSFWKETDDFYVLSNQWNRYSEANLEDRFGAIYDQRSAMLHDGVPFPASIELGFRSEVRFEATLELFNSRRLWFKVLTIPWFERVVNACLLEFLSRKEGKSK